METPRSSLRQQALRDLHWALFSPSLFTESETAGVKVCETGLGLDPNAADLEARLQSWDHADSPFVQQIQRQRFRKLGPYFEALIGGWLTHHPDYDLLVQGEPIRVGHRTVGEVDFLYWEKSTGQLVHLEVAVKFYLSQSGLATWEDWVGPNPIDRLDRKWLRMQQHQATLLRQPVGQAWLAERGLPPPEARILIKGCFFSHATTSDQPIPEQAYAEVLQGGWLRQHEAMGILAQRSQHWQALPRLDWLAPAPQVRAADLKSASQVLAQTGHRPQQWRAWPQGPDQPGERMIIVPDHWPAARPPR